jgi:hypothetical protein
MFTLGYWLGMNCTSRIWVGKRKLAAVLTSVLLIVAGLILWLMFAFYAFLSSLEFGVPGSSG